MVEKIDNSEIKVYKKRWWIILLFIMFSASNSIQWAQYAVVEDVMVDYYKVNNSFIEWTALLYSFTVSVFIIPWAWLLEKYGFRKILLVGSWLNSGGALLKVFSGGRTSFMIAFIGQCMVAVGQLSFLPSRLAALWFGDTEVSTACSLGVFGNQIGVAMGFLLPPIFIKMNDDKEVTQRQINYFNYSVAGACVIAHCLLFFCLEERPLLPPSRASMEQRKNAEKVNFPASFKRLLRNKGYILLLLVYGVNMGVFCAATTLLNRMVLTYFPYASEDVGRIGLLTIMAAMCGSLTAGFLLDRIGHYVDVSLGVCICATISSAAFAIVISGGQIYLVYIASAFIGYFMAGYFTVGYQVAAELTYPENEGTSSGILNGVPQAFTIATTTFGSWMISQKGVLWCCYSFTLIMIAGTAVAAIIPKDYRRQAVKFRGAETQIDETKPLTVDNHV